MESTRDIPTLPAQTIATPPLVQVVQQPTPPAPVRNAFDISNLNLWYGQKRAVEDVTINIPERTITAVIGPSGCGKSTFLRCLNRMHELVPKSRMTGSILFFGQDLYGPQIDPALIRRRIGML